MTMDAKTKQAFAAIRTELVIVSGDDRVSRESYRALLDEIATEIEARRAAMEHDGHD